MHISRQMSYGLPGSTGSAGPVKQLRFSSFYPLPFGIVRRAEVNGCRVEPATHVHLDSRLDGSLYELLEVRYGLRPHRARESLEPVTARVREAEALEVREGAPLMLVERIAYARSGEPLEYARDLFRGDRTKVVVWTSELAD
jgi:UTRA domain